MILRGLTGRNLVTRGLGKQYEIIPYFINDIDLQNDIILDNDVNINTFINYKLSVNRLKYIMSDIKLSESLTNNNIAVNVVENYVIINKDKNIITDKDLYDLDIDNLITAESNND